LTAADHLLRCIPQGLGRINVQVGEGETRLFSQFADPACTQPTLFHNEEPPPFLILQLQSNSSCARRHLVFPLIGEGTGITYTRVGASDCTPSSTSRRYALIGPELDPSTFVPATVELR
jgi:hypothetical protein